MVTDENVIWLTVKAPQLEAISGLKKSLTTIFFQLGIIIICSQLSLSIPISVGTEVFLMCHTLASQPFSLTTSNYLSVISFEQ